MPLEGRICQTCRWWQEPTPDQIEAEEPPPGWKACGYVQAKQRGNDRPLFGGSLAVIMAEDPYICGTLITAPGFGCLQWRAQMTVS